MVVETSSVHILHLLEVGVKAWEPFGPQIAAASLSNPKDSLAAPYVRQRTWQSIDRSLSLEFEDEMERDAKDDSTQTTGYLALYAISRRKMKLQLSLSTLAKLTQEH